MVFGNPSKPKKEDNMDEWIVELTNGEFSTVWADGIEEAEKEAFREFDDEWLYVHKEDEE
jgi:hypothetical protein